MAIITCPECRGAVSDRAPMCVHCGCPLAEAPSSDARYVLVLLDAGPSPEETAKRLSKRSDLGLSEALEVVRRAPVVLYRDLKRAAIQEEAAALSRVCGIKVVHAEEAATDADAVRAAPVVFPAPVETPKPLTFWSIVGAVMVAQLLLLVLSGILSMVS